MISPSLDLVSNGPLIVHEIHARGSNHVPHACSLFCIQALSFSGERLAPLV
jgi:hypothetical protein